jgi:adenine-specific DNA-methyltransferase
MPTLHWIGKEKVVNHHQDVPYRILEHQYSFFDKEGERKGIETKAGGESGNKIIHGDNLEALKALLPEYEGKIKCIYIDPPYNTGNEGWVYNDNVNDPKMKKWLYSVVGREGEDLSRHDKWLCMMYPRLKLLHKLLADDGIIFISIDDNEQANLKLICDEIFGGVNYYTSIIWQKSYSPRMDVKDFSISHDYIISYRKSSRSVIKKIQFEQNKEQFKFFDETKKLNYRRRSIRKEGMNSLRKDAPNAFFPLIAPDGTEVLPIKPSGIEGNWRWSIKKYNEELSLGNVEWVNQKEKWEVYAKQYLTFEAEKPCETIWYHEEVGSNHSANDSMRKIFGDRVFDSPKPSTLIEKIIQIAAQKGSVILDSFAGSGTTAHAVLNLNKQDGGNRKFILIEMEDYAETITAERVKRVIKGYGDKEGTDGNFSFYKLGRPLFNEDGNLNEEISIEELRQYIYYTETKESLKIEIDYQKADNPYFLDQYNSTSYYFYYEKNSLTALNNDFLATIKKKADQYVIYADNCLLSKDFMLKKNIIFKKIPRDITRF